MQGYRAQQLPTLLLISRLVDHGHDLEPVLAITSEPITGPLKLNLKRAAVVADVAVAVVFTAPAEGVSVDGLLTLVADLVAGHDVLPRL